MDTEYSVNTIYSRIKNYLLNSDLYPGQKIPHLEICKEMKISFSPLREAFIRLTSEGLLVHKNQRGFFVPQIGYEEARELYDARMLIEPYLVKEAAKNITEKNLVSIRKIHNDYEKMVAEPYSRRRLLVDKNFHLEILKMGKNEKLVQIIDELFNALIVRRTLMHLSPERPHRAAEEHFAILESLAKGDGKEAPKIMKAHLSRIKKFVLDDLKNRTKGIDPASYLSLHGDIT